MTIAKRPATCARPWVNGSRNVLRRRKVARLYNPPADVPVWSAEHEAVRCDAITGGCERIWDADRSRRITFPPMF